MGVSEVALLASLTGYATHNAPRVASRFVNFPDDLRYSKEHEWVRLDGGEAVVGITDFAQDNLGDIVFVQLPDVGASVARDATCSEVESTKSVSDIYAPVSGRVTAVNEALANTPELLNSDPYG